VTPGWLPADLVARLRADAVALHGAGVFTAGELGGRGAGGKAKGPGPSAKSTVRLCDVCGLFDDALKAPPSVGDPGAREELFDALLALRGQLEAPSPAGTGRPLAEHMELQYLRYPKPCGKDQQAGFYGRHVDQQAIDLGPLNNRCEGMSSALLLPS
jgi:hypothetical protein